MGALSRLRCGVGSDRRFFVTCRVLPREGFQVWYIRLNPVKAGLAAQPEAARPNEVTQPLLAVSKAGSRGQTESKPDCTAPWLAGRAWRGRRLRTR